MLEKLRGSKEQSSGLLRTECLADIKQVDYPREECPAFPRTDGGIIENASFLNDGSFVVVVRAETALFFFFGRVCHGRRCQ